jgi:hypothetical protein
VINVEAVEPPKVLSLLKRGHAYGTLTYILLLLEFKLRKLGDLGLGQTYDHRLYLLLFLVIFGL